jgi:hypothetical protein
MKPLEIFRSACVIQDLPESKEVIVRFPSGEVKRVPYTQVQPSAVKPPKEKQS